MIFGFFNPQSFLPRWIHKLYANALGYFWLPCTICGRNFGGHEWKHENTLMSSMWRGEGVCRACGREARFRNRLAGFVDEPGRDAITITLKLK